MDAVRKRLSDRFDRFQSLSQDRGLDVASVAALKYVIPDRIANVPEVKFTLNCLMDWRKEQVDFSTAAAFYRDGFFSSTATVYDFEEYDIDAYVTDFARSKYGWKVNGAGKEFLTDKVKFHELLENRGFEEFLPRRYGTLHKGVFTGKTGDFGALVRDEETIVVKKRRGGGGSDVHVCAFENGSYRFDGEPIRGDELIGRLGATEYLVTEYCEAGSYALALFPDAASTIRAITMNPTDRKPFVVFATHRLATARSAPLDNFAAGGISTQLDDNGQLGIGLWAKDGELRQCEVHPDTGTRIPGTTVPGWSTIRDQILEIAEAIPECPYVGWDIIVTGDGEMKIIEGNANTGVELQIHQPLLTEQRVRSFYEDHGLQPNATPTDILRTRSTAHRRPAKSDGTVTI